MFRLLKDHKLCCQACFRKLGVNTVGDPPEGPVKALGPQAACAFEQGVVACAVCPKLI